MLIVYYLAYLIEKYFLIDVTWIHVLDMFTQVLFSGGGLPVPLDPSNSYNHPLYSHDTTASGRQVSGRPKVTVGKCTKPTLILTYVWCQTMLPEEVSIILPSVTFMRPLKACSINTYSLNSVNPSSVRTCLNKYRLVHFDLSTLHPSPGALEAQAPAPALPDTAAVWCILANGECCDCCIVWQVMNHLP